MKTFDEAFEIVSSSYGLGNLNDLIKTNIKELSEEQLNNLDFRKLIYTLGSIMLTDLMLCDIKQAMEDPIRLVRSHLHTLFLVGLLTGMEMEK